MSRQRLTTSARPRCASATGRKLTASPRPRTTRRTRAWTPKFTVAEPQQLELSPQSLAVTIKGTSAGHLLASRVFVHICAGYSCVYPTGAQSSPRAVNSFSLSASQQTASVFISVDITAAETGGWLKTDGHRGIKKNGPRLTLNREKLRVATPLAVRQLKLSHAFHISSRFPLGKFF